MNQKRENWDSRAIFVMAAVGSAVGLGNIWRFPYTCYSNGGGAFLIPYFVALLTAGIPLMLLEFGLGHKFLQSAPGAFKKAVRGWEWLGWLAILVGLGVMTYYGVIMAWAFNFLYYTVQPENLKVWADGGAPDFFYKNYLQLSDSIGELGGFVPYIVAGLILTWLSVYFSIIKGVKSVGKVVLITVPLPVLILFIFLVRGLTLEGCIQGLEHFLRPDFAKLADPKIWLAAYGQIFFSLSIGFGVMIAYASFLPKKSDIANNAFMTCFANCGISFLAGMAVFSTLGWLALQKGTEVADVAASGPGLAFVTYPTIISLMPIWVQFFGVLFFLLLLTFGIDSAFSLVEAGVAGVKDKWKMPRIQANTVVSVILAVIGLLYTTRAGLLWLDIIDYYLNSFALPVVGALQCIAVGWLYGAPKLREHINATSDFKIGLWWDFCIKFLTPALLIWMLVKSAMELFKEPYEGYPSWAQWTGGWGMLALLVIVAFILAAVKGRKSAEREVY